jgi:hypothetical protein
VFGAQIQRIVLPPATRGFIKIPIGKKLQVFSFALLFAVFWLEVLYVQIDR